MLKKIKNLKDVILCGKKIIENLKRHVVPRKKFEEEPEYYSFDDNYDYGDYDYEQDND